MSDSESRKKIFAGQVRGGQRVEDVFFVSQALRAETKTGNPYLILTLMDKSGELAARVWDNAEQFAAAAAVGNLVLVRGQAQTYQKELQLKVDFLQQLDKNGPGIRLADFLPVSKRPAAVMLGELTGLIESIRDPGVGQLLRRVFSGEVLADFAKAPAAKRMHHAYLGGLLEHTLSVARLAEMLTSHYPQLDRDLLLCGALLHDLGKIREFSYATIPFDYTDSGRLIGHMLLGSDLVRRAAEGLAELPAARLDQVLHLILSHHGRHDFGAPVLPQTLEAILLHHVDDMDSKVNYIERLSASLEEPGYHWSEYQRPLERYLLLRKPAAEDLAQESAPQPPPPAAAPEGSAPKQAPLPGVHSPQRSLF